jgi:histidinol-phosphate aminotransferase
MLQNLVRKNIQNLKAYSSARDEFTGREGIFLDANENPFGTLNRYPDPYQKELKTALSTMKKVSANNIFIGNGSDEVIDLLFRIFCNPGQDKVLTFSPTYGMYDVSAAINDVELLKVPLDENFQISIDKTLPFLKDEQLKLIFICSPNNPTGNILAAESIRFLLENFSGIVVIDEAYIDFSETESWVKFVDQYPNLVVSQTFSKAWGLAAARVGVAYANEAIVGYLNKVKPPYNVSRLNQEVALLALKNQAQFQGRLAIILKEKQHLISEFSKMDFIKKIYPSAANFILIEVDNAPDLYEQLVTKKVIVRNRHSLVKNALRITVGAVTENEELIETLKVLENTSF